ncbi:MAG: 7-cyano-7-deazaguanine synthase [Planctomycetota bacterium]|nr:7-cyano-7-deazaguanine synthase [Planctomycetota bacterium]
MKTTEDRSAMKKNKVVVLCSGGLNSAVVASLAAVDYQPALLHVRLGHRASKIEDELFDRFADHMDAGDRLKLELSHFEAIGGNARINRKGMIEDAMALGENPSNCHMPGLIGSLLFAGFSWAWQIGAAKLLLGVSENLGPPAPPTSRIYPDYSREFIQLCGHAFGVASGKRAIEIETPVIDLGRSEIVRLGQRFGTPFELTWSCVAAGDTPCTRCAGCATRGRGFLDVGIPDPVMLRKQVASGRRRSVAAVTNK